MKLVTVHLTLNRKRTNICTFLFENYHHLPKVVKSDTAKSIHPG